MNTFFKHTIIFFSDSLPECYTLQIDLLKHYLFLEQASDASKLILLEYNIKNYLQLILSKCKPVFLCCQVEHRTLPLGDVTLSLTPMNFFYQKQNAKSGVNLSKSYPDKVKSFKNLTFQWSCIGEVIKKFFFKVLIKLKRLRKRFRKVSL